MESFFKSKPETFYKNGIKILPRKWQSVIDSNRAYFFDKLRYPYLKIKYLLGHSFRAKGIHLFIVSLVTVTHKGLFLCLGKVYSPFLSWIYSCTKIYINFYTIFLLLAFDTRQTSRLSVSHCFSHVLFTFSVDTRLFPT